MVQFSYFWAGQNSILKRCRQLLETVNKEKFLAFVAVIVFRARYIACVSAMNIEHNFDSVVNFVRFLVLAPAPVPISLLEQSFYTCFHSFYLFATISLNLFW